MGLAGRGYRLPTGAAWGRVTKALAVLRSRCRCRPLSATPRAGGLVLLLTGAAALESATASPLAFTI